MEYSEDQIEEVKAMWPQARMAAEGGTTYVLIENATLPAGLTPSRVDLLFCPTSREGYHSRLFFSSRVSGGPDRNWNGDRVRILERDWFAMSWQVPPGQRLAQTILSHLRALKP